MAIIGILASIGFVTFKSSVRKANEAAAVATLNTIKLAQAKYVSDHDDEYGTFKELFEDGHLDKRFNADEPHIRGYVYTLTLIVKSKNRAPSFTVSANPEHSEGTSATGKNFYYTDPDNGICVSKSGPATAADEML
jgi:type II secretory pathway pseudopilin PulG